MIIRVIAIVRGVVAELAEAAAKAMVMVTVNKSAARSKKNEAGNSNTSNNGIVLP